MQSTVKNYTLRDSHYRLRAEVGVIYGSDMDLVVTTLKQAADAVDSRMQSNEPLALLTGFGDSSVNFEVSIWIDDPWRARPVLSQLHQAIWRALKEAGITIAFPQLDVHFDQPIMDSAAAMAALRAG